MAHDVPVPPDLAAWINAARLRLDLSVEETARLCDISGTYLHGVPTGRRLLAPAVARSLIALLQLDTAMADEVLRTATGRYGSIGGLGVVYTDPSP
ncbi:MAG: helix-turn-helix domain-containing protein [Acidimicrobiia bacterium]